MHGGRGGSRARSPDHLLHRCLFLRAAHNWGEYAALHQPNLQEPQPAHRAPHNVPRALLPRGRVLSANVRGLGVSVAKAGEGGYKSRRRQSGPGPNAGSYH